MDTKWSGRSARSTSTGIEIVSNSAADSHFQSIDFKIKNAI